MAELSLNPNLFLMCKNLGKIRAKNYTKIKSVQINPELDFSTGMRIRHFFPRILIRLSWKNIPDPNPTPDPTWNRNEEKNIYNLGR